MIEKPKLFNAEGEALDLDQVLGMLPLSLVTRVEIIDENGRSYVNWKKENIVDLSLQDLGKTLKIFISQKK
jgi:hypothetical protein